MLAGAVIGDDCNICDQVFIEGDVVVGSRVTVKCGVQLYDGLRVEDDVFIGTPPLAFTFGALLSLVLERLLYRHLYRRGPLDQVLLTVGIVFVAAIVTPPDPLSQCLLAIPIYGLYEISIWCVRLMEIRRKREESKEVATVA